MMTVYENAAWRLGRKGISPGENRRCLDLLDLHRRQFGGNQPLALLSAPGRVEIIGNHTDHNHGAVLAAAVNLDTAAAVSARGDSIIRLLSAGYPALTLDLSDLNAQAGEAGTTAALIRGVAAGMNQRGYRIGGFDAVMNSQVLSGSGLSSSAAFEVLVCYILDVLYNGTSINPVVRAQIGQYAENAYFMKPSGLMDQMASSFGGMVKIDFAKQEPDVEALNFSFAQAGYAMAVVNTDSSHDDLTPAYAAIPAEMKAAAAVLGGQFLRDSSFGEFMAQLPAVRAQAGDRAALRALHFYQENQRVVSAAEALKHNRIDAFFHQINESGLSSWTQLQNISVSDREQPMALALALARQTLGGKGACRVHGGGFAGTTLNFVPLEMMQRFVTAMEAVFGPGCCHALDVRKDGPIRLA